MADRATKPHAWCALARRVALRVIALAAVLVAAGGPIGAQQPAAPVQVDPVRVVPLEETIDVLGRVVARREGAVAARIAAPVAEVRARVGDVVEAGQVLVVLDTTRLQLEQELARAELQAVEADHLAAMRGLDLLRQERDRLRRLEGSAAFSGARLEDKNAEIAASESRVEAAKARLESARTTLLYRGTDLEDAMVRAPYPGVVVERLVSAGAYVRVGDPVVVMVDHTDLEIEADVPAERLAGLSPGTVVGIEVAGVAGEAVVRAVVPMENPMTRTRAVRLGDIAFAEAGGIEAVGQSAVVRLPLGAARDLLSVHKDAVTLSGGQRIVFVVDEKDTVMPRPVVLGAAIGDRFAVLEGLTEGDLVVVRGNERLQPGQQVAFERPVADDAAAEAPDERASGS
ncbi:MAG: efflux RND transporter periplasmic adaptor subunit [Geminicoccaceae bacterium]|nr:efflux RND transporter periplasmic adaptor subunit [Geminicoccaceae bacterium]